jgi:hypothetical protein
MVLASGLVIGSAVLCHAKPQPQRNNWTAEGAGFASCSDFEKAYKAAPDQTTNFFSWTQGYLSGMDQTLEAEGKQTTNLAICDAAKQDQFVRSFCASYPNRVYGDAATALFLELRREQGIPSGK